MKLQPLFAIPLALVVVACSTPPEITATSRDDANEKCFDDLDTALAQISKEQQLARSNPRLASFDTNPDYYTTFEWNFMLPDEFGTVEVLRSYCKPYKFDKHKGVWGNVGYIEYLTRPSAKYPGSSEVSEVIASYGYQWKE